jgi:tRNA nucleotidyltransferase (CCA-adding enzyme)
MLTLPQSAQDIIVSLKNAGYECYAVGGSVRDTIMGRPTHGWDYTTSATPEEILSLFPDSFYDNQFGTVGIKIYNPADTEKKEVVDIYEITTYRSEKGYTDNRHPDVIQWGNSLNEDLSRRDFTINAIAWDGDTLVDPYDGQKDIENTIIKAVGDPDARFSEDALRMMRAVRIASELGFMIEPVTLEAIKRNAHKIVSISKERVRDELFKLLKSSYAADGILLMKNAGILYEILPEFDAAFGTEQKSPKRHHIYDVGTHSVMALKYCPSDDPVVRLATLLHDIGKPKTYRVDEQGVITFYNHEVMGTKIARKIVENLRLSKKDAERVLTLIRWHQFSVDERQTDSAIRRFIRRVGKENLADILALRIGDRLGGGALETSWRLELYKKRLEEVQLQPFTVSDLKINGYDVMNEYGVKPGRIIGIALDALFKEVEEGTLQNEHEVLITRLRELKSELLDTIES